MSGQHPYQSEGGATPDESPGSSGSGRSAPYVPKPDRRSERTRRALLAAFNQLIFDVGYDAMRVGDILERADIGRSTFYQHYRSKDDLLRQSVTPLFAVLADTVGPAERPEALVGAVAHFRENRRLARALFGGPTRVILVRRLAELIEERLPAASALLPAPLLARHIAEAQMGLLDAWLGGRSACRSEDIAAALRASSTAMAAALAGAAPRA
jgi:AcrR family transcriptional regulator